ncbi:hypothetical protein ACHQM5_018103 [Ranunculus cassubicifolius]
MYASILQIEVLINVRSTVICRIANSVLPFQQFLGFLEILCKNSGKIRRFAKGTDSQFALELINEKLSTPLASYIEAVKDGEEPINFGPKSILIDYGNGWKLQTATTTTQGFEEDNSVEPLSEHLNVIFEGREELINWCKMAGRSIGVVIVIERSDRAESGRRPRVVLTCERSGVSRIRKRKPKDTNTDTASRKQCRRNVETKKCDCPFRLLGCPRDEVGWEVKVICGTHNHLLGGRAISHSYDGRLAPEERELLIKLSKAGAKPREILNAIKKKHPNNASTRSTIYNYRSKNKLSKAQTGTELPSS